METEEQDLIEKTLMSKEKTGKTEEYTKLFYFSELKQARVTGISTQKLV